MFTPDEKPAVIKVQGNSLCKKTVPVHSLLLERYYFSSYVQQGFTLSTAISWTNNAGEVDPFHLLHPISSPMPYHGFISHSIFSFSLLADTLSRDSVVNT